MAKNTFD